MQDAHILEVAIGQFQVVTWRQFGSVDPEGEVVWLECATAEGFITLNWVRCTVANQMQKGFTVNSTDVYQ